MPQLVHYSSAIDVRLDLRRHDNKGSQTAGSQMQTGLTQIYPFRSWEAAFEDWDVGLEERRNLHSCYS